MSTQSVYQQFKIPANQISQPPPQLQPVPVRIVTPLPELVLPPPPPSSITPPPPPINNTPTPPPNQGGLIDKINNGAARVAGVVAVGSAIANAVKDPSLGSAASLLGAGLTFLPNPYAQAVGLALSVGGALSNAFKPVDNLAQTIPNGGSGSSVVNVGNPERTYNLFFEAEVVRGAFGAPQGSTLIQIARGRGGQENGFQGSLSIGQPYISPSGVWVFPVADSQGSFVATTDFNSIQSTTPNAQYGKPVLVDIRELPSSSNPNPQPVPIPPPTTNSGSGDGIGSSPFGEINNDGWFGSSADEISSILDGITALGGTAQDFRGTSRTNNGTTAGINGGTSPTPPPAGSNKIGGTRGATILGGGTIGANQGSVEGVSADSRIDIFNFQPQTTPLPTPNNKVNPIPDPLPEPKPKPDPKPKPKPNDPNPNDRFKEPSDCQFSCTALANCFVDVKVLIFDGCDTEKNEVKTKEITIQVLPKDANKTKEIFKEFLAIRSKECSSANANIQTTPDYWRTRVGQIPQAVVLYRSVPNDGSEPSYYQLQIPHYNGSKSTKPRISAYEKGNEYAIYYCKDGSSIQVNCSTRQECLRVITELEKYINPRMRANNKDDIKYGTRKGLAKVRVKPIRLDFSKNGQADIAPTWSINL